MASIRDLADCTAGKRGRADGERGLARVSLSAVTVWISAACPEKKWPRRTTTAGHQGETLGHNSQNFFCRLNTKYLPIVEPLAAIPCPPLVGMALPPSR
jgi:hypothetical protein